MSREGVVRSMSITTWLYNLAVYTASAGCQPCQIGFGGGFRLKPASYTRAMATYLDRPIEYGTWANQGLLDFLRETAAQRRST